MNRRKAKGVHHTNIRNDLYTVKIFNGSIQSRIKNPPNLTNNYTNDKIRPRRIQYRLLWRGTAHHIFPALNLNASIDSLDCEQSLFWSKIRGKNLTPAYHVRKWACDVIDANCQTASEMQYESRAVSLFALRPLSRPRYSRLAASPLASRCSPLAARISHSLLRARLAGILEQKRDCSQSMLDITNSYSTRASGLFY